jgi:phosphatidylglycerophosphatase A
MGSRFLGSAAGLGLLPFAPGTFGTLAGVGLAVIALWAPNPDVAVLVFAALVTMLGVPLARAAEREAAREDPGWFVLDEVAGFLLAVAFTPLAARTPFVLLAAFVAFRVFDIAKPWPLRRLEKLPRGWGVMADDLAAGVYANVVVQVAVRVL